MYQFESSSFPQCRALFDEYLQTACAKDDFWEEHVLGSKVYSILMDGQPIGILGIYNGENLTFFHLPLRFTKHAQPAFDAMLSALSPQYAFVSTFDELFLSLCMDRHTQVEKQAYFFQESGVPVRPCEWDGRLLRLATKEDATDILDDTPESIQENIRLGKYYVLRQGGVFLGQGFLNPLTLSQSAAAIGMSVHPDHRQKGVGRSIILHLKEICYEKGLTPFCGCWYYNHNSKRTLESAGFVTKTRLLKVWFIDKPAVNNWIL